MPTGIYKHKPCSEEIKKKIRKALKGRILTPKTLFKKGNKINVGRKCSNETKRKIGVANEHANWRGGRHKDKQGYIHILVNTRDKRKHKRRRKYYLEHRLVIEKHLGRYLERHEWVHHKNGIKDDNRLENLEIVVSRIHKGRVKCPHCQKKFSIK